jgi:SAM-dependent methyltransferase
MDAQRASARCWHHRTEQTTELAGMEIAAYTVEAEAEETHWWFVGRRKLFADEIDRAGIPADARVLDVGTGTGSNLRMLRDARFTRVTGLDGSDQAIRFCAEKGFGFVRKGDICAMPFGDASFDFVLATDVIEHVADDGRAIAEIARVLETDGRALITVPAFQSLWGLQDRRAFHKRRYRLRPLVELLHAQGLTVERAYYFNYILFIPIWIARRLIDLVGLKADSENEFNTPWLNRALSLVFSLDVSTAGTLRVPFGVSILAIAKK